MWKVLRHLALRTLPAYLLHVAVGFGFVDLMV